MDDVKKIMVPITLKPDSEGLFNYAAQITALLNAELIVASIINSRDLSAIGMVTSLGYKIDSEHYVEGVKAEREKILEQFLSQSSVNRENIRTIIKVGNPVDALLKLIVKEDIDMIVMGIKGHTDLEHILVGSVAEKLFRRSPVPVISYRDEKSSKRLRKKIKIA